MGSLVPVVLVGLLDYVVSLNALPLSCGPICVVLVP